MRRAFHEGTRPLKQLVVHIGSWTLWILVFSYEERVCGYVFIRYHHFQEKTEDLKITYRSYQLEKITSSLFLVGTNFYH